MLATSRTISGARFHASTDRRRGAAGWKSVNISCAKVQQCLRNSRRATHLVDGLGGYRPVVSGVVKPALGGRCRSSTFKSVVALAIMPLHQVGVGIAGVRCRNVMIDLLAAAIATMRRAPSFDRTAQKQRSKSSAGHVYCELRQPWFRKEWGEALGRHQLMSSIQAPPM